MVGGRNSFIVKVFKQNLEKVKKLVWLEAREGSNMKKGVGVWKQF